MEVRMIYRMGEGAGSSRRRHGYTLPRWGPVLVIVICLGV
jgi:hypothetical protein